MEGKASVVSVAYVPPQNSTELLMAQGPVGSSRSCSTDTPMLSILTGSGYTLRARKGRWGGVRTRKEERGRKGGRRKEEKEEEGGKTPKT